MIQYIIFMSILINISIGALNEELNEVIITYSIYI